MAQYFGKNYNNIGTNEKPIYRLNNGASPVRGRHIWRFVSEGSAPLLIDQRVLFAPQYSDGSRLYVSDISGVNITQTIFNGPYWPDDSWTSQSTGSGNASRTSLFADWSTATSTNVDVYINHGNRALLKIQFDRTTQTFGTPHGYGKGDGAFNANYNKIAGAWDGDECKTFLLTHPTGQLIGGTNRMIMAVRENTRVAGEFWEFDATAIDEEYIGDFRPLIKSLDGNQLVAGGGETGQVPVYAQIIGINHVTGRVYYRNVDSGFMHIFQIDPNYTGSNYAEKLANMGVNIFSFFHEGPRPELAYYKTVLLPTVGGDAELVDLTINFDHEGNETGISYGSYYDDAGTHNVDMGIIKWDPSWN